MAVVRRFSSALLLLLCLLSVSAAARDHNKGLNKNKGDECVYSVYVKTGSIIKGGTDSKIGLSLADASGRQISVPDLEAWGLMDPGHDYYERGNLDIFSGRSSCLSAPLCRLNLTSDGSGPHHGWYCDYVEVTSTGPHMPCGQTLFYVRQWLASDAPPYQLTAFVDGCDQQQQISTAHGERTTLVVGGDHAAAAAAAAAAEK